MLPDLNPELTELGNRNLLRRLRCVDRAGGTIVSVEGRECVLLCSNNYLSLATHPKLGKAASVAIDTYGASSVASALICGHTAAHEQAHEHIADLLGTEGALSFPTGYAANLGAVTALVGKGDTVYSDALNHRSLIDACRLSRADVQVYRHGDVTHLADLLSRTQGTGRRMIVTDGVFSMDGDLAPLPDLVDLADRSEAILLVDDAHATGVFGPTGGGTPDHFGLAGRVDVITTSASKGLGSFGGYIAGSRSLVDLILNKAATYIFTSALPPQSCASTVAAVNLVRDEPWRRERLLATAVTLKSRLRAEGFETLDSGSQIIPLVIGDPAHTVDAAERLFERGIFLLGIRPPTVPQGSSRLRLSLMTDHTDEQIDQTVGALVEVKQELEI